MRVFQHIQRTIREYLRNTQVTHLPVLAVLAAAAVVVSHGAVEQEDRQEHHVEVMNGLPTHNKKSEPSNERGTSARR